MKIGIIDDSRLMRESLHTKILKLGEYVVKVYESGGEYLQENDTFDIIFLDGTLLTGLPAYDTLNEIIKKNPNQYVIIFGGINLDNIPKWLQLGAKGFMSKPPETGRLKEIFDAFM